MACYACSAMAMELKQNYESHEGQITIDQRFDQLDRQMARETANLILDGMRVDSNDCVGVSELKRAQGNKEEFPILHSVLQASKTMRDSSNTINDANCKLEQFDNALDKWVKAQLVLRKIAGRPVAFPVNN